MKKQIRKDELQDLFIVARVNRRIEKLEKRIKMLEESFVKFVDDISRQVLKIIEIKETKKRIHELNYRRYKNESNT